MSHIEVFCEGEDTYFMIKQKLIILKIKKSILNQILSMNF